MASAAFAFSATTVEAKSDVIKSPIEDERICAERGLRPDGIAEFAP